MMNAKENVTLPPSTSISTVETNNRSRRTSLNQTRHHINSISAPTQNTNKVKTNRTDTIISDEFSSSNSMPSAAALSVSFANKNEKKHLTAYEKLLYDSQYDMRFKAEEKAGRRIGFYRIRGDIGLGNFSRVKLGVHLLAKEKVAIKILDKTKLDERTQRLLLREITSMERLHHPNIIRLYEVIETPTEIYIVNEYASGGELYTRITKEGKFIEDEAKTIFAQITAAVDHVHRTGIIHRDIKSENVFFAKERLIKLGDFGFSTFSEKNQTLTTFCGSPPYAAPELFRDENYIGIYVDLWAMGILLYFMVTGLMPFRAENVGKLKKSILEGHYSIPAHVSDECQQLIRGLLHPEATQRWPMEQIRACSWLSNQNFPNELEPLPLNLTNFWTSVNKDLSQSQSTNSTPDSIPSTSSFEHEAHSKLEDLGITSELLQTTTKDSNNKCLSNRDSINGTYRIILHRLQKQSNPIERDDFYGKTINEDLSTSWGRSMSVSGEPGGRRDSFGKANSVSCGGTSAKPKRSVNNTPKRQSTYINGHGQQPTKVCMIL
ncbi:unnamed protein product [Rotaria magnacalcarata]|uniref:non-specific serine/threonine protein kinase n=1 Tax=Rotaria magnacalcarata TaxID=392030 RepID=A0A816XTD2_9BILA|nr:unnamed protein product [Rotaria magnacalcarata]CAF2079643.1 unnamed protein product [Rotaria magnacalcarata]CAF2150582.1 unnamed protein product [Rotaria magnacalcarata]CAF4053733.1 unnamed protein product [Rotaria magnacalcarata]CAF4174192.1 unnamed protein product [Rotaria magnacalcarata]